MKKNQTQTRNQKKTKTGFDKKAVHQIADRPMQTGKKMCKNPAAVPDLF